jgi:hypothetical protein
MATNDQVNGVETAFLQPLHVDIDRLTKLAKDFATSYKHLALTAEDQFLPTPITKLPSGEERGKYLAIDLGGTNLRVGFIELLGDPSSALSASQNGTSQVAGHSENTTEAYDGRIRRTFEKAWPIDEHLKTDKAEDLFEWIGSCIAEVVVDNCRSDPQYDPEAELSMGVTFSFPMMSH